mgnify:CR=1 FL=1
MICDFGLSRGGANDTDVAKTAYVVTRYYRAPELLCRLNRYDAGVDIWSTALIVCEMLTGEVVLRGKSTIDQLRKTLEFVPEPGQQYVSNVGLLPPHTRARAREVRRELTTWPCSADAHRFLDNIPPAAARVIREHPTKKPSHFKRLVSHFSDLLYRVCPTCVTVATCWCFSSVSQEVFAKRGQQVH